MLSLRSPLLLKRRRKSFGIIRQRRGCARAASLALRVSCVLCGQGGKRVFVASKALFAVLPPFAACATLDDPCHLHVRASGASVCSVCPPVYFPRCDFLIQSSPE